MPTLDEANVLSSEKPLTCDAAITLSMNWIQDELQLYNSFGVITTKLMLDHLILVIMMLLPLLSSLWWKQTYVMLLQNSTERNFSAKFWIFIWNPNNNMVFFLLEIYYFEIITWLYIFPNVVQCYGCNHTNLPTKQNTWLVLEHNKIHTMWVCTL